jgi:site-specific recombinase XerD
MSVQQVVVPASRRKSWTVLGLDGVPVERYLAFLTDIDRLPNTVKAYAHDLKDRFVFLAGRALDRREVRLEDVGEFVAALHHTTVEALRRYQRLRDRLTPMISTSAFFVSTAETRLIYCNVHNAFHRLVRLAGLTPRSASCRPRIHDLRHSFAVRAMLDAYAAGQDGQARLTLLSTWLGHVHPGST